jgi:hypothetical protein
MRSLLVVLFTLALSVACGPSYIDGTTVPDTVENRELVTMIEDYRLAVENRDVSTLAQLVSRSYFENASTTGITDDDYGYEELLKEVLPVLRDNVRKVIYKLTVERVQIKGSRANVFVAWELTCQYVEGGQEGWSTAKDRNRIDLVIEDGRWKIISGL